MKRLHLLPGLAALGLGAAGYFGAFGSHTIRVEPRARCTN